MASSSQERNKRAAENYKGIKEKKAKKLRPSTAGDDRAVLRVFSTSTATSELTSRFYRLTKVHLEISFGGKKYKPGDNAQKDFTVVDSIHMWNFDNNWRIWFEYHEFPNIKSLEIDCSLNTVDFHHRMGRDFDKNKSNIAENLSIIFSGMKSLKHLKLRCEIPYENVTADFELESAEVYCLLPFIESSAKTLKRIKLSLLNGFAGYQLKIYDLQDLFSKYEKLEDLAGVFHLSKDDLQKHLPTSETILNLDIHVIDKVTKESDIAYLEYILASTPLLESLTIYIEVTPSFLKFLAENMFCLKKVIVRGGISKEAITTFNQIKKDNGNSDVMNTKFVIIAESGRDWKKHFA